MSRTTRFTLLGAVIWGGLTLVLFLALVGISPDWERHGFQTALALFALGMVTGVPPTFTLASLDAKRLLASVSIGIIFGLLWGITLAIVWIVLGFLLLMVTGYFPLIVLLLGGGVAILVIVGPIAGAVTGVIWRLARPSG